MNITLSRFRFLSIFLLAGMILTSCQEFSDSMAAKPTAFGSMNAVFVVADQDIWDGPVGDTIRYYFESPVILMPQPEPMFDLRHFTVEELKAEQVRKELRHYLIVANIDDDASPAAKLVREDIEDQEIEKARTGKQYNTLVGRDKWAFGQQLYYVFAPSQDKLFQAIADNYPALARRIRKADENQVSGLVYGGGENRAASNEILATLGLKVKVPKDYYIAINDSSTIWVRFETEELSSNILISKIPYRDTSQLTKEGLLSIRDSVGKEYITTAIDGAYMHTNDEDLPVFVNNIDLNGYYTLEARGIWETVGDYMGGPFVSYLFLKPDSDHLYFIDLFIHAPSKEKRDYMQQLEYIIRKSEL